MGITDIFAALERLKGYGVGGSIVAVICMIIYGLAKTKWVGDLISKGSDKLLDHHLGGKKGKATKLINESDILNHDIFSYIDFWTLSKVPILQFSTEYRTIIFRKYLTIYLKGYKEELYKYINDKKYEQMTDAELWQSFLILMNSIIYSYEKEMDSVEIPRIVIEKMKTKNNDTISLTIDLIEGICNSQFYDSEKNLLKIYSILNIILSILENTISNSEHICNSINGALHGLEVRKDGKTYIEP